MDTFDDKDDEYCSSYYSSNDTSDYSTWYECEILDQIIECNILSIRGDIQSPYQYSEEGETLLTDDTVQFMDTIISINENGFMTLCSQPGLFNECYDDIPIDINHCYTIKTGNPKFGKNLKKHYQKAFCDGFIKCELFDKLKTNIEKLEYDVYYLNSYLRLKKDVDKRINVTYDSTGDLINEGTNIRPDIKEHQLYNLRPLIDVISSKLFGDFMKNYVYIYIVDKEFSYLDGKNIYRDIIVSIL